MRMTAPDESNKQQHFGIVPKELMQATPVLLPLLLSIMQSSAKQRAKYELKCRAVILSCYHFCSNDDGAVINEMNIFC